MVNEAFLTIFFFLLVTDGGWSMWYENHLTGMCERNCTNPEPQNGGSPCRGPSAVNCSQGKKEIETVCTWTKWTQNVLICWVADPGCGPRGPPPYQSDNNKGIYIYIYICIYTKYIFTCIVYMSQNVVTKTNFVFEKLATQQKKIGESSGLPHAITPPPVTESRNQPEAYSVAWRSRTAWNSK